MPEAHEQDARCGAGPVVPVLMLAVARQPRRWPRSDPQVPSAAEAVASKYKTGASVDCCSLAGRNSCIGGPKNAGVGQAIRGVKMRTLVLAVLMASAASSIASAETPAEDQSIKGWFKGWGEIDASGRLKSFAPDGKANPALAQALREELQGVAFAPARIDAGATIRTYLDGGYRLVEDGEGYVLQVTSINAGPKVITRDMPRPPHRLLM